jgi:2-amino-4-hydroxy-6-hydroxymethyldihydropteridine diphosphokinase
MSQSKPAASAHTAFLGLGSNLGDRLAHIAQAIERLEGARGTRVVAVSSVYVTAPVGLTEQPEFFNAVAQLRTEQTPEELLATCRAVEDSLGRARSVRWGPRTLDLDILIYDDLRLEGASLVVPHPRMKERAFVMVPLAEIAPDLLVDGVTAADRAASVDSTGVWLMDAL